MTTVGQSDQYVPNQTNNTEKTTANGNTDVFTQGGATVATASKPVVAVIVGTLPTEKGIVGVGCVALCGAVVTGFAFGQINLDVVLVQVVLAHQCWVFST